MISSVFLDIDGTLVSMVNHKVSERVKETLRDLRRRGVRVFVATGRPIQQIDNLDDIEFDGWVTINGMVCWGAGAIRKTSKGRILPDKLIHYERMPYKDVEGLERFFNEKFMPSTIMVNSTGSTITYYDEGTRYALSTINYPHLPELRPDKYFATGDLCQVTPMIGKEDSDELLTYMPGCKGMRNNPYFIDIAPRGVDKANGIKIMLDQYGLPLEGSVAFGDGENDIDMIKAAGIGVAMGNALPQVKSVADIVAPTCEEDGISVVIDSLL